LLIDTTIRDAPVKFGFILVIRAECSSVKEDFMTHAKASVSLHLIIKSPPDNSSVNSKLMDSLALVQKSVNALGTLELKFNFENCAKTPVLASFLGLLLKCLYLHA